MVKNKTRKIAVTMNKGGCGKTTTAVHLAAGLAREGKTVLLIDADPQSREGNGAKHLGLNPKQVPASLKDFVIDGDKSAIVQARENLFLIRGGLDLNTLRRDIDNRPMGRERVFIDTLTPIERIFDYIIFDTAPSWDAININTLFFCDEIIIPINLEGMTVSSLSDYLVYNLSEIQKFRPTPLKWGYALPTRYDRRVGQSDTLLGYIREFFDPTNMANGEFMRQYSNTVLCAPIGINVSISESAAHGKTVYEHDKNSTGSKDYMAFVRSVMRDA